MPNHDHPAQLYNFPGLSHLLPIISELMLCCSHVSFFSNLDLLCTHHLVQQQLNPSSVFPWLIAPHKQFSALAYLLWRSELMIGAYQS